MSHLLTVFGATGAQGGSVINYVLQTPILAKQYRLRGITRDTSKPASVKLQKKGVEMVQADLDDPSSLLEAVKGSHSVFGVTNFWEKMDPALETAQGRAIADAAVAAGASHLIWSSLPSISQITNGAHPVAHFDSKAAVEEYVRTLPIGASFFMAGWYMQNHLGMFRPQRVAGGGKAYEFVLKMPWSRSSNVPIFDVTESGKYVGLALRDPKAYAGKRIYAASEYLLLSELAQGLQRVTGKSFGYETVPLAETLQADASGEILEHLSKEDQEEHEFIYFGLEGLEGVKRTGEEIKAVGEQLTSWEEFVKREGPWVD